MKPGGFDADRIRSIHLELTTQCNARCPMCARTGRGATRPGLAMTELSLDDIHRIFPGPFLRTLESIDLCGAFGDPLVSGSLDEIIRYFRAEHPALKLDIYTNASLRPPEWWARLPALLGPAGKVCFGIDGLADTHALYRVNTSFETIIRNAGTFLQNGGRAQWDFIAFRHNQHQVEDARRLARSMGFETFSVKVSGRFFRRLYEEMPELDEPQHGLDLFPVYSRNGEHLHDLQPPDAPGLRNATVERLQALGSGNDGLEATFDTCPINCLTIERGSYFISAEGTAFPCCWTAIASKYGTAFGMKEASNLRIANLLAEHGGPSAIDARQRPLAEIVRGPFFTALAESWQAPSVTAGRPKICARMCGECFSPRHAYTDPALSPYAPKT
jgi:MoaA/NifB/PqqE/SkfB family radical SAM enzyme